MAPILPVHEATPRRQKRFERRARTARLRHAASVEDIDTRAKLGLASRPIRRLAPLFALHSAVALTGRRMRSSCVINPKNGPIPAIWVAFACEGCSWIFSTKNFLRVRAAA